MNAKQARDKTIAMLEQVRIPDASRRFHSYPHELSGGMRQRVMIAMALLCEPELLIADEPTTALDVTVQSEIMALLRDIRTRRNMAIVLITHDLPLAGGLCDRIAVMRHGASGGNRRREYAFSSSHNTLTPANCCRQHATEHFVTLIVLYLGYIGHSQRGHIMRKPDYLLPAWLLTHRQPISCQWLCAGTRIADPIAAASPARIRRPVATRLAVWASKQTSARHSCIPCSTAKPCTAMP